MSKAHIDEIISIRLRPEEIPVVEEITAWLYDNKVIASPTGTEIMRFSLAKLSQEYYWIKEAQKQEALKQQK